MAKYKFSLLFLLSLAANALADPLLPDGSSWLKVMAFAAHQTDYSGTFVYQYGSHVETSRITHIADSDGEHSRLESLDGLRREIIRNNGDVWCDVGNRKIKLEQRQGDRIFPALLPEQISLLEDNYQIKQEEDLENRVAGFHTHVVTFLPRDSLRYTHKMWAHSDSGLLLKAAALDERGRVIEQYAFTQLTIGSNIDRNWVMTNMPESGQSATSSKSKHSHASGKLHHNGPHHDNPPHAARFLPQTAASPVASGWQVDALPPGFKKIAEVRRQMPDKKRPVIQMVFSDGLASISVFIEKSDNDEDDHPGLSSQGILQVYNKLLDGQLITVVGEVPPRTVIQVADSLRFGRNK